MLFQFSVENYCSIRDKVFLVLEPSNDSEHPENIVSSEKYQALSTLIIYGANASGKSNLFKAISTAVNMVRNSISLQTTSPLPVIPYKFDEAYITKPTSFEFTFLAHDGLKYIYGFSATREKITEEYLYCFKSSKPSRVFERSANSNPEYNFTRGSVGKMRAAASMTTPNKLFLSTATSWNVEETKPAWEWLTGAVEPFSGTNKFVNNALDQYRLDSDHRISSFTQELLKQADINISNISVTTKTYDNVIDTADILLNKKIDPSKLVFSNGNLIHEVRIDAEHEIINDNGTTSRILLDIDEESEGTKQIVYLSPILRDTFDNGKVLIVDELDNSLHPFLVKYLINLFRNKKINSNGAQLICTTHETTILSLDTFRRDQICFTEKSSETGITDLYTLSDFSVRKDENIQRGYLLGRYGAIPYLQTTEIFS